MPWAAPVSVTCAGRRQLRRRRPWASLFLDESEQILVDLILHGRGYAVGCTRVDLEPSVLDLLRGQHGGGPDRDDLIIVAVQDQGRHVELLEVLGVVGLGEHLDALVEPDEAAEHALKPEGIPQALGDLGAGTVGSEEWGAEVLQELRAVGEGGGAELIEGLDRGAAGIGGRLEHERRNRADQHGLGHPLGAVATDVPGDLSTPGRMPDVNGVLQVELLDQGRKVVGVGIHVVAAPRLARAAVPPAIMRDTAVSPLGEKQHLVFPGVRAQRPPVAEHNRLAGSPVLVVNLGTIFGGYGRHATAPGWVWWFRRWWVTAHIAAGSRGLRLARRARRWVLSSVTEGSIRRRPRAQRPKVGLGHFAVLNPLATTDRGL